MNQSASLGGAFIAGLVSFLSPCVLPLVPAYLSYITGLGLGEMRGQGGAASRWRVLIAAFFFVLGFSLVFIVLGASATLLGKWLLRHSLWLGRLAGALLVLLGLHLTGLVPLRFLMMERRLQAPSGRPGGFFTPLLIGGAFAFGWTPCVGPLLAGILALAGTRETLGQGILLLAVYSAGLGIPFLLAAAAVERFLGWMARFRPWLRWIEWAAGGLLIALGAVMMLGNLGRVSAWFAGWSGFSL